MQSRTKQAVLFSAKVLLSIGVLVYIARGLDLNQLRTNLLTIDPAMFLLALALIGLQTFVLKIIGRLHSIAAPSRIPMI